MQCFVILIIRFITNWSQKLLAKAFVFSLLQQLWIEENWITPEGTKSTLPISVVTLPATNLYSNWMSWLCWSSQFVCLLVTVAISLTFNSLQLFNIITHVTCTCCKVSYVLILLTNTHRFTMAYVLVATNGLWFVACFRF